MKIITWILVNGASVLGIIQAAIKSVKEVLTGVVNVVSLILPNSAAKALVEKVRGFLNTIDGLIEKLKQQLIK